MKLFVASIICCVIAGCAGSGHVQTVPDDLAGIWTAVEQEIGGKPLPKAAYDGQKLILADSSYTVVAESVDKGIVRYTGGTMDIYGREGVNAGKHFTAIYKREGGRLTICYNLAGDSYPAGFETLPKTLLFLSVFTREPAQ